MSSKFFNDLIAIEVAVKRKDGDKVLDAYEQTRQDFDQLVVSLKKF